MNSSLVASFTPTGRLRAAINLGNPILANKDKATGQPVGVSIDLAHAFASRLGADAQRICRPAFAAGPLHGH